MTGHQAIDCWVNVTMGDIKQVEYLKRAKEDYFKAGEEFFTSCPLTSAWPTWTTPGSKKPF